VGYQPTLETEVAALQERIASGAHAAITAIEAVYVPADDFTDPAVSAISTHMDSTVVLSRDLAAQGIYPAIDPLRTTSVLLDPTVVSEEHAKTAADVRQLMEHYEELRDVIALLGVEELGREEQLLVGRARRLQRFLTQPFFVAAPFTGIEGRSVPVTETIAGCRRIIDGGCDDWAEASFYMIGAIEEAETRETARKTGAT
jgi:F-type H+-transporting ATPase subunit beta